MTWQSGRATIRPAGLILADAARRAHLKNLFVCGADQGFVGIIGSMTSGIGMANLHCLRS